MAPSREGELTRLTGSSQLKRRSHEEESYCSGGCGPVRRTGRDGGSHAERRHQPWLPLTSNPRRARAVVKVPSSTSLANNYSHIDIDSTDDIGDGNKIIFKYQLVANTGSLGDSPSNRNSYLGVTGGWGTFKMGTNENVYERFMYESDPLDGAVGVGGNIQMLGHSGQQGAAGSRSATRQR